MMFIASNFVPSARPCGCGQVFPDQRPPRLERPGLRGCSRWGGTYHETTQALQLHWGLGFTGKETWRKCEVRKCEKNVWGKTDLEPLMNH